MNRLKIIILFLLPIIVCSCNRPPDLTEDEIYKILNELMVDNQIWAPTVYYKFEKMDMKDEYLKEFTKDDIRFNERQSTIFENMRFKSKVLKYYSMFTKTIDYCEIVGDDYKKQSVVHFSIPYISVDRQMILFEYSDLGIPLGSSGETTLYVKKNGHWVMKKNFIIWNS
jgi:hypothetical protein